MNTPSTKLTGYAIGLSESERFLFAQCQHSYLQLWSYANLFRDQGKGGTGEGKELCDVMVLLGNSVVLFSDKKCSFPDTGCLDLDWRRWEKRAITESRMQLAGAERWIRQFPNRIFLDRPCTRELPIALPTPEKLRIYKVAVALGAGERFRRETGGSGSLFLSAQRPTNDRRAFVANLLDAEGDFVHILDDVSLPVLLRELDTLPDLLEYFDAKETLIRGGGIVAVAGEEDLIGLFIGLRAGMSELNVPDGHHVIVGEGIYGDVIGKPQYRNYKEANKISYFWDDLIRHHSACVLGGTLIAGSAMGVQENEEILRLLAGQPRVFRRVLSAGFVSLHQTAPRDRVSSRMIKGFADTVFVFRIHPRSPNESPEQRRDRVEELQSYCFLTAWRNRGAKNVVGICSDGRPIGTSGFDVVALQVLGWNEDGIEAGQRLSDLHARDVIDPLSATRIETRFARAWEPAPSARKSSTRGTREERRRKRKEERRRRRR